MKNKLTWRDVLDSYAEYARLWGSIDKFLPLVRDSGYRYFNWNGRIYELINSATLEYKDTGLTVEDL